MNIDKYENCWCSMACDFFPAKLGEHHIFWNCPGSFPVSFYDWKPRKNFKNTTSKFSKLHIFRLFEESIAFCFCLWPKSTKVWNVLPHGWIPMTLLSYWGFSMPRGKNIWNPIITSILEKISETNSPDLNVTE